MWSEEIRNNLYKGLENQLDNKNFYDATRFYNKTVSAPTLSTTEDATSLKSIGHIAFDSETTSQEFSTKVNGISFLNKIDSDMKLESTNTDNQKIYRISDLLSANLTETTIIPLSTIPTNLSLVKRFEWRDVLFSDVKAAFHMIKDQLFNK